MRGVLLAYALQSNVWTTKATMGGRTTQCSSYDLSWTVDRVGYFVSHAWTDDGERKLAILREFLSLQALLGQAFIALPVLALFLLPLGLGFTATAEWFPWWSLSAVPLALLLLLLAWVQLSCVDIVPLLQTPWAFSPTLVRLASAHPQRSPGPLPCRHLAFSALLPASSPHVCATRHRLPRPHSPTSYFLPS